MMTKRECRQHLDSRGNLLVRSIVKYLLSDTEIESAGAKYVVYYSLHEIPKVKRFLRKPRIPDSCFIYNSIWADHNQWILDDIIKEVTDRKLSYEDYRKIRKAVVFYINDASAALAKHSIITMPEVDAFLPVWSVFQKTLDGKSLLDRTMTSDT